MIEKRYSYCRNCSANCGTEFEIEDGLIVAHRADRQNPSTKGFMCVKGDMAVDLHTGAEPRLRECLKRGADGEFRRVSAAALMDEVASGLDALIAEHGPGSVAMFYGTCGYQKAPTIPLAKDFLAKVGSPNLFSTMTIDQSAHWVAEGRMGLFATGRPCFQDIDAFVLAGTNPIVSHGTVFIPLPTTNQREHLKSFKNRGGRLVIIDPRRSETAMMADIHVQPRPGFDTEIFASIIRIMLEEGWHDAGFCARYITNLDALEKAVTPFDAETVAALAGIDAAQLLAVAQILRDARRPSISFGTGTSMSPNPNTAAHMIYALNAICGGYARAGDKVRNPGVFLKRATVEGVIPPGRSWEKPPKLRSGYGQLYGEFPSSRLADEILAPSDDRIRALIVVGGNPMMAMGSPDRVRQAFERLELLVVLDPRMTDTARRAHYIVAPPLQYEVHDCNVLGDVMNQSPFVQYVEPVVPPPPGTLEEWRFFHGVASRMGKRLTVKSFRFGAAGDTPPPELALAEDRAWETADIIAWYCAEAGLSLEELKRHPHGMEPDMPVPTITAPERDDGARLDVCPTDVAAELTQIPARGDIADAPYRLVSRRIVHTMNSAFRDNARTTRLHETNSLYMHPLDMAEEDLSNGDPVVVAGRHGSVVARVTADTSMRRRVVSMTHCWGTVDADPEGLRGAHTARLVSLAREDVQDIDGMPLQSAIPITLEKWRGIGGHGAASVAATAD